MNKLFQLSLNININKNNNNNLLLLFFSQNLLIFFSIMSVKINFRY